MRCLRAFGAVLCVVVAVLGPSEVRAGEPGDVEPEPDVVVQWGDDDVSITSFVGDIDVTVRIRVTHGDDDLRFREATVRVLAQETLPVAIHWPDLSHKGDLLLVPGVVSGFAEVVTVTGADLGVRPIERKLVVLEVVLEPGEVLASISPRAALDAGVQP